MPEGHLIHRDARAISADLARSGVRATSPQGKFDADAIDGATLTAAEAYGKHLLLDLDDGRSVHVHLGMRGLWLRYPAPPDPPRGGVRLRLQGDPAAWDLIAPTTCEVVDQSGRAAIVGKLGRDPLRPDVDPDEAVRRLRTARGPVAAAIVDQAVWAGVGNAWRAELLHLERIDPRRPARELDDAAARALWERTRTLMELGRDAGQVVSDPSAPAERWVYKRETCRSCGAPVRTEQLGGRTSYACPVEQV